MAKEKTQTSQEVDALLQDVATLPQDSKPAINFTDFIVDFTQEPTPPDYLLSMDGVGIIPRGGITAVTGKKKQGKSHFLAALASVLISGRPFGKLERRTRGDIGHILWVDTEQSAFNIQELIGRVYKQAGIPERSSSQAHGLTVLKLRPLEPSQRVEVLLQAIEAVNPSIIIIDGLRDLINDFNDISESNAAVNMLLNILDTRPEVNIITVLHENEGSDRMRGHLGSELGNKAQDIFQVSKENGIFKVKHETRGREVLIPFTFCVGGGGELATATIEQTQGVVEADEALTASVPEGGADFHTIVKNYANNAVMTQRAAKDALKERLKTGQLIKTSAGLFELSKKR